MLYCKNSVYCVGSNRTIGLVHLKYGYSIIICQWHADEEYYLPMPKLSPQSYVMAWMPLPQEAHAMVRAAKVKQVAAEKKLREATNKVITVPEPLWFLGIYPP